MKVNLSKFSVPVLGGDADGIYSELYQDLGSGYVDLFRASPEEIAVISRMIAYLTKEIQGVM